MTPLPSQEREPLQTAAQERAFQAEQNVLWIRNAIIVLNVTVFWTLLDQSQAHHDLALATSILALLYTTYYTLARPYRHYPVMLGAPFTSITEALLITLWVYATGAWASPFYVLWYVSLAAIAFRFDFRITLAVSVLYASLYVGLLAAAGDLLLHVGELTVRLAYIFFVGLVGGLLSRESTQQTQQKIEMRALMLEARHARDDLGRREEELRRTVSLLGATLDSTADGILVVDEDNRIVSFNQKFVQMWRLPRRIIDLRDDEAAIGFVLDQLVEPDAFVRKVKELYADPAAESFDTLRFKDGRTFERYSQPQRVEGHTVGRVWSFRDVTRQRQAEQENLRNVERAQELERLKELDAFKTRFVNSVAHELWTPLTPIKLQLHVLQLEGNPNFTPTQRTALDVIRRNMDRLQHLVKEMLDGARLQAGRFRMNLTPSDLSNVLHEVVDLFQPTARQAGIDFESRIPDHLPVVGDPNRLTQVLSNLLSNAFKFTPRGGRVRLEAEHHDGRALVRVVDNGIGLTPDQINLLFQPFSQAHDTMEQTHAGTGLGLYISQAIVEAHHGSIHARSPGSGQGSTFEFWIPLNQRPTPESVAHKTPLTGRA